MRWIVIYAVTAMVFMAINYLLDLDLFDSLQKYVPSMKKLSISLFLISVIRWPQANCNILRHLNTNTWPFAVYKRLNNEFCDLYSTNDFLTMKWHSQAMIKT